MLSVLFNVFACYVRAFLPSSPLSAGGAGAAGRRRRGEQLGLAPRGVGQTALLSRVLSERRQAQTAARGWSASAACCRQTQTAVRHGTTQLCRSRPSETGCWQPRREPVTPAEGPRGGNRAESRTAMLFWGSSTCSVSTGPDAALQPAGRGTVGSGSGLCAGLTARPYLLVLMERPSGPASPPPAAAVASPLFRGGGDGPLLPDRGAAPAAWSRRLERLLQERLLTGAPRSVMISPKAIED